MAEDSRWTDFCVVGIGGHARTKLIPAIEANGQRVVGLVSRQSPDTLPDAPVYANLADALAALRITTAFVIASPPALHFEQAMAVLRAGHDVIIEKPAFLTAGEVQEAAAAAHAAGALLVEAFMQRHTKLYARALTDWAQRRGEITGIEIPFVVPGLPQGTFRGTSNIAESALYDIGCYPVSLLADLDIALDGLNLESVVHPRSMEERLYLGDFSEGGFVIGIDCGVSDVYENRLTYRFADGSTQSYAPFFYGRSGLRTISSQGNWRSEESLVEGNAFEAMFSVLRDHWQATQAERVAGMIATTATLERLGDQLKEHRAASR